jgi:hypothetical protein
VRLVDLGPCPGLLHEHDPDRCVVVLPGMRYTTQAPLLWFAREAAERNGWSVLEVLDSLPVGTEPFEWARDRARRAFDHADAGELVAVGKSLASGAAGLVADRVMPAVWLTPLLDRRQVVDDISRAPRPALLIGGSRDETWRPDGLDHSLQREGDPLASIDALRAVTDRVDRFLDALGA